MEGLNRRLAFRDRRRAIVRRGTGLGIAALGGAAAWLAWMAWDHGYHLDPATGRESGPYEAWQVLGSALTLASTVVVACLAQRRPSPVVTALVSATAYTVVYAVTVAPFDENGLLVLGVALVAVGTTAGGLVLAVATDAVRRRSSRP